MKPSFQSPKATEKDFKPNLRLDAALKLHRTTISLMRPQYDLTVKAIARG